MLLEDLCKIVKKGAERPLFLWLRDYNEISKKILPVLEKVVAGIEEKTNVRKNVEKLVKLLKQDNPNELELAKSLAYISELFDKENLPEHAKLINNYVQDGMKFYSQAQTGEFHRLMREKVKKTLKSEAITKHDLVLFSHEGMMYCLEYYLAMYKAIQDAPTETEKRKFIDSVEVNLGFGNIPGLRIDFSRDEVLGKFIYSILDDKTRNILIKAYFGAKLIIINKATLKQVISAFRDFINVLLGVFQTVGIDRLTSYFFTPYGKKPLIKDIKI